MKPFHRNFFRKEYYLKTISRFLWSWLLVLSLTACAEAEDPDTIHDWYFWEFSASAEPEITVKVIGIVIHKDGKRDLTKADLTREFEDPDFAEYMSENYSAAYMNCVVIPEAKSAHPPSNISPFEGMLMFNMYDSPQNSGPPMRFTLPEFGETYEIRHAFYYFEEEKIDEYIALRQKLNERLRTADRLIVAQGDKSFVLEDLDRFRQMVKEHFPPKCQLR